MVQVHTTSINTRRWSHGFTFLEVLFAVIVLGIGFIMVAGMFPVAIQQQQASVDDTMASTVGPSAMSKLTAAFNSVSTITSPAPTSPYHLPTIDPLIPTGNSQPADPLAAPVAPVFLPIQSYGYAPKYNYTFPIPTTPPSLVSPPGPSAATGQQWLAGMQIYDADPSYAWTVLYARDSYGQTINGSVVLPASGGARVVIVTLKRRDAGAYLHSDTATTNSLQPHRLIVSVNGTLTPNTLTIVTNSTPAFDAPGAWVVISSDSGNSGSTNGYYFKLGDLVTGSTNVYYLQAGSDLSAYPGTATTKVTTITSATAYMVGRGADSSNNPSGPAQEIGVLSGVIQLPPS